MRVEWIGSEQLCIARLVLVRRRHVIFEQSGPRSNLSSSLASTSWLMNVRTSFKLYIATGLCVHDAISSYTASTFWRLTMADNRADSIPMELIINGNLGTFLHRLDRENAHPEATTGDPKLHFTIRIARVVAESSKIPCPSGINVHVIFHIHGVKMPATRYYRGAYPAVVLRSVNDFANVLNHKCVHFQGYISLKPETFSGCFESRDFGIFPLLESLIAAAART